MNCQASEILDGLYLGSLLDARDKARLDRLNITHILSILDSSQSFLPTYRVLPYTRPNTGLFSKFKNFFTKIDMSKIPITKEFESNHNFDLIRDKYYLCVKAEDQENQNLSQYFSICNDFIHSARLSGNNVLVHCLAGVSRSATIVCAYLMSISKMTKDQAIQMVRARRNVAHPNIGFQTQLKEFELNGVAAEQEKLNKKASSKHLKDVDNERCQQFLNLFSHDREKMESDKERIVESDGMFRYSIMYPLPERNLSERKPKNDKIKPMLEGTQMMPNVYFYAPVDSTQPSKDS